MTVKPHLDSLDKLNYELEKNFKEINRPQPEIINDTIINVTENTTKLTTEPQINMPCLLCKNETESKSLMKENKIQKMEENLLTGQQFGFRHKPAFTSDTSSKYNLNSKSYYNFDYSCHFSCQIDLPEFIEELPITDFSERETLGNLRPSWRAYSKWGHGEGRLRIFGSDLGDEMTALEFSLQSRNSRILKHEQQVQYTCTKKETPLPIPLRTCRRLRRSILVRPSQILRYPHSRLRSQPRHWFQIRKPYSRTLPLHLVFL